VQPFAAGMIQTEVQIRHDDEGLYCLIGDETQAHLKPVLIRVTRETI
jgi:hypothetical protein